VPYAYRSCCCLSSTANADGGESPGSSAVLRLNFLGSMHRLTARLLLLVLLAGTCAPLAGAMSMPVGHDHCVRKPLLGSRAEAMPACHHHAAAVADLNAVGSPISELALRSRECCSGHQCCRSLVRSQWAQVSLQTRFQQTDRTDDHVSPLPPHFRSLARAAYHSVRAPPVL
jgi:hypothetical protein